MPEVDRDTLNPHTLTVLTAFGRWFSETDDAVIDIDSFKVYFFNFLKPHDSTNKKSYYNNMLDKCVSDADPKQTEFIIEQLVAHTFATQIGNLVSDYTDEKEIDIVEAIGEKYTEAIERLDRQNNDFKTISLDINPLLDIAENKKGVKFSIPALRDGLVPLQSGELVIAAGRPDTGKTSFLTSQLSGFLDSLPEDKPILWLNNEGEGNKIIKRIYQSSLKATTNELLEKRLNGTLNQEFLDVVPNPQRIQVLDIHDETAPKVEKIIKHFQPGLVILDMIDNITFPNIKSSARTDEVLEKMYQWARKLGVKYHCPIIATSQISVEAEHTSHTQMWPAQSMLKDSKTGKQGAADVIIMIGRSLNPEVDVDARFISTPKNKIPTEKAYIQATVVFEQLKGVYR